MRGEIRVFGKFDFFWCVSHWAPRCSIDFFCYGFRKSLPVNGLRNAGAPNPKSLEINDLTRHPNQRTDKKYKNPKSNHLVRKCFFNLTQPRGIL